MDTITKIDGWKYLQNDSLVDTTFQWEDLNSKLEKELSFYKTPFINLQIIPDAKNKSNLVFNVRRRKSTVLISESTVF